MEGGGGWESHTLRPEQLHSISDAVSKDGQLVDVLAPALSEHAVTFTSGKDGRNTTKHDEMKRWFLTNLPEHIATSKSIVDRACQWFVKESLEETCPATVSGSIASYVFNALSEQNLSGVSPRWFASDFDCPSGTW